MAHSLVVAWHIKRYNVKTEFKYAKCYLCSLKTFYCCRFCDVNNNMMFCLRCFEIYHKDLFKPKLINHNRMHLDYDQRQKENEDNKANSDKKNELIIPKLLKINDKINKKIKLIYKKINNPINTNTTIRDINFKGSEGNLMNIVKFQLIRSERG